jgi:hypothetical protein
MSTSLETRAQKYWEVSRVWNHRSAPGDTPYNVFQALQELKPIINETKVKHMLHTLASIMQDDIIKHGCKTDKKQAETPKQA